MSTGWKNGFWELFKCPLCGGAKYVEVRVQKPNGHWYTTEFFQCFTCSIMFRDPVLFSRCMVDTTNDDLRLTNVYAIRPEPSDGSA